MRRSSLFLPVAALCLLAISDAHNINRRGAISVQDDTEGPVFMDSFDDFFKKGSWLNFKPKEETPVEEAAAVANEEVVRSGGDGQVVPDGIIPDGATVAAPIPNGGQAEMSKTPVPNQQVPNRQDPGAQQAPNKQMPNSQAPNKQMPNSQVPNQPVQNASATDPSSFEEVVRQERNVGQYQPAPERPTYPGYLGVAQNQQKRPQNVGQHNGNRNNQYNYRPQYNQQKPIYRPQYNKQKPIYRPRYPQQPAYPSHAPYPRPQQQQYRPIPVPQRPQYSPFPILPINPYKFMQQQQHNHASHSHGTPSAGVPNKYVAPNKDGTEAPNKARGY